MRRIKHRSSRRVSPPKDSDFDHEINLVDQSAPPPRLSSSVEHATARSISPAASSESPSATGAPPVPTDPTAHAAQAPSAGPSTETRTRFLLPGDSSGPPKRAQTTPCPPTHVQRLTPESELPGPAPSKHARTRIRSGDVRPGRRGDLDGGRPEIALDVLYENQRGGFLCGVALFSSMALGQLDPPAWTNAANKPSPSGIGTAQVPDPSWEWAWPEWRINCEEGVGEDGWVYSFMFSTKFKWHKPRWWNSFVRRRIWIRKRVKRRDADPSETDPFKLNQDYFSVRASSDAGLESQALSSRDSISTTADLGTWRHGLKIEDIETLLQALRKARIDREKIEAVENYLKHATDDLVHLQDEMHDIMSLFVFQASRRLLLARLTDMHEETVALKSTDDSEAVLRRAESLSAATKHADEEVRRLEYWSDIKAMAEEGESKGAVGDGTGWDENWQGLDQSGPSVPMPKSA